MGINKTQATIAKILNEAELTLAESLGLLSALQHEVWDRAK